MSVDIKRPVFLSGENPGMTLYETRHGSSHRHSQLLACDRQPAWDRERAHPMAG